MTSLRGHDRGVGVQGMRAFLVIWLGQVVSIIGSGLTGFALGVWMFEKTGQATPFAMTVLFATLPRLLLAPVAGSLADRWNRRWIMVLADSGSALVTVGAIALVMTGRIEVWHVYGIALLGAVCSSLQEPAYLASIAMLVPNKDLARANGMVQSAQAVEMLLSPLLAGALFGVVGMRGIFLIDLATYVLAVGSLLVVTIPQPRHTESVDHSRDKWRDLTYGWRFLRARPGLFGMLLYFALVNFFLGTVGALSGPLVLSFAEPVVLGTVQMASGVGMLLGSVAISVWGGPRRRVAGVVGAIAAASVGVLVMGLRPSSVLVAAGMAVFLFFIPIASGCSQAIFQTKVPPDSQGRVFAARSMISGAVMPIAYLATGPLADRVFEPRLQPGASWAEGLIGRLMGVGTGRGIGFMFVIAGVFLMIASLLAWTNPRIRHVEAELPDVEVSVADQVT